MLRVLETLCAIAIAGLAVALGSSPAHAQTVVTYDGNTVNGRETTWPFNLTAGIVQMYWTPTELGSVGAGTITHFGLQFVNPLSLTWPSVEIVMGETTLNDPTSMSTTFANNFVPGTPVTVFNGPLSVTTTTSEEHWQVPLTTPYSYSGTQNLIVEIRVLGAPSGVGVPSHRVSGPSPGNDAGRVTNDVSSTSPTATFGPDDMAYGVRFTITPAGPEIDVQRPAGTSIVSGTGDPVGTIGVGVPTQFTYTVANTGASDLTVTSIVESAAANCAVSVGALTPASPVPAAGTATFNVDITPTTAAGFSFTLTINNDDTDEGTYTINVTGTGIALTPEIDVQRPAGTSIASGGPDNLGATLTAAVPTPFTYTVANSGTAVLNVTSLASSGESNCAVAIGALTPASPVGTSSTATFTVNVTPTAAGAFSFTLTVNNDDSDEGTYTVNASGSAVANPEIDLQIPAGTSIVNGGTATLSGISTGTANDVTVTIANLGLTDLTLSVNPTATAGTNCTASVTTNPASLIVGPSSSSTFVVSITPTAVGAFDLIVTVNSDDADEGTYTITLDGTATTSTGGSGGGGGGCCGATNDPQTESSYMLGLIAALFVLLVSLGVRRRL